MTTSKRVWSAQDLAKLALCYQARAPLYLISQYFGTSISGISKTLTRSQIRPAFSRPRGVRPLRERGLIVTIEQLHAYLESNKDAWKQGNPNLFKARPNKRIKAILRAKATRKALTRSAIQLTQKPVPKKKANGIGRKKADPQELWTSMNHVVEELTRQGYRVLPIENTSWLRMGYTHLLNGKPVQPADMLKVLNSSRQNGRKPLVFVPELTSH